MKSFTLKDGTVLDVQELKDINGNPKYLFNDPSGVYTPFSWSPHMPPDNENPDALDVSQKTALEQILEKMNP